MLSYDQAENMLFDFLEKHLLLHCGLEYEIVNSLKEIYGEDLPKDLETVKGYFLPTKNTVYLVVDQHKNKDDFSQTMQHEIFGHVAINYLSSNQKVELLNSIEKEFKNPNSELREIIDKVQKQYPEVSSKHHAEEVFAYTAESTVINLENSFKPFSLVRGNTKEKIESVVQNLTAGIREGTLKQRIFPKDNSDLGVDFSQSRPR